MKEIKASWRGTPGVGDFMWALNSCHLHAQKNDLIINLEFHWPHGPDHLHHFEEEETIIERLEYIHNLYMDKDRVRVTHLFDQREGTRYFYNDQDQKNLKEKNRFWFEDGHVHDGPKTSGGKAPDNDWLFRNDISGVNAPIYYNRMKVVIWRPLHNAEIPRLWKRLLTNDDWDVIIGLLRQAGLHVVELTYRTPVREAMFHINTSRMVLCYDGMWHYMAKNACIPMIVSSDEGITKYHTPNAIRASASGKARTNIWFWVKDVGLMLGHTKKKTISYRKRILGLIKKE